MLLGPGEYLCYRRNVRNELFTIYGIDPANVIIMEDVEVYNTVLYMISLFVLLRNITQTCM
jgi:hypothetical protein